MPCLVAIVDCTHVVAIAGCTHMGSATVDLVTVAKENSTNRTPPTEQLQPTLDLVTVAKENSTNRTPPTEQLQPTLDLVTFVRRKKSTNETVELSML